MTREPSLSGDRGTSRANRIPHNAGLGVEYRTHLCEAPLCDEVAPYPNDTWLWLGRGGRGPGKTKVLWFCSEACLGAWVMWSRLGREGVIIGPSTASLDL